MRSHPANPADQPATPPGGHRGQVQGQPAMPGGAGGDYASRMSRRGEWWLLVPGLGNGLEIALWAPLFWLPVGTPIRPMGTALFTFVIAGATLLSGGAVAGQLFAGRRYARAVVCLLTSLSPLLVAGLLIRLAMDVRGLTMSD